VDHRVALVGPTVDQGRGAELPEGASLAAAYERCRQLHGAHGRTYYLATRLLPAWKRRHVHALYGFARYADDIVDRVADLPVEHRAEQLTEWSDRFFAGLTRADGGRAGPGQTGASMPDPLLPAVLHTIGVFNLDLEDFRKFLASMAMDLTVASYRSYDDLLEYMEGSAAVIGTMMLPLLEADDPAAAREPARQLGIAFQLTNFIRDVAEDLDRGRVYLPLDDLDRFGLTPADLVAARDQGHATAPIRALIEYEVERAHTHYAAAALGIPMLARGSQRCIRAAFRLYGGILGEIERQHYDVFVRRAVVPDSRRLQVAVASLLTRPGTPVRALRPTAAGLR